jgi:peroxiredoxin Q/BCP
MMLQTGDLAPDFTLLSDSGEPVTLADLRGQRVVLFFYPKADTPGCTTQACGFRDNWSVIEAAGATVLGISPDQPQPLAAWKQKQGFPYPLLSDADHAVAEAYGVWGEKKMYGRSYMGMIRSHFVISADGTLEDVRVKVSPADSIRLALQTLAATG